MIEKPNRNAPALHRRQTTALISLCVAHRRN
jgi:hypothetical protein